MGCIFALYYVYRVVHVILDIRSKYPKILPIEQNGSYVIQ